MRKHQSENVVLKVAWYSSKLLGIPASVFRSSQNRIIESPAPATTGGNEVPLVLDRETVVKSIKDDFSRSYLCHRHVEHWNIPKMTLLKQLPRPTKAFLLLELIRAKNSQIAPTHTHHQGQRKP